MTETLLVAVVAGMVATVNPCGFAMLPAYLTLVVTGSADRTRAQLLARAVGSSALMTLGFVTVFGLFGVVVAPVFASVQRYLPFVTVVIGVALLVLGALLLAGREIALLVPKPRKGAPNHTLGSMFGYGIAYAIASLSCTIGPFLAVAGTSLRGGDIGEGVAAFVAYAAGMGLVVTALAVATALASTAVITRARGLLPHISRIGGALLVLVGLYVTYYGVYELRLFLGGADPADPVVDAAGTVQNTLVTWLTAIGPLPPLIALVALLAGGTLLVRRRKAHNRET
ncbi:cytochrome c biogenesis CcdA family protein [Lentzea albidocapillata]|uniref:Cytochrome c biogenesis protein CcdA n=1 Tax=Lentzea albidocapillata TaxID=40571 RepID=A0A1W2DI00_9PSEU|nr:cytochrome c biogenesis protein CcdA [Lentzea albidocapillata]SMC96596.1 Cytochrome c biogenesis protein CcdA [Lentzea albidocapillata]